MHFKANRLLMLLLINIYNHHHHHLHHQKTPLHHAVMNDDVFNLTKLLDDGADPNAQVSISIITKDSEEGIG